MILWRGVVVVRVTVVVAVVLGGYCKTYESCKMNEVNVHSLGQVEEMGGGQEN